MGQFTLSLGEVIEHQFGASMDQFDYEQPFDELEYKNAKYGKLPVLSDYSRIGLGTYPIFDESYRAILNGKIIDEYWNRDIGFETIELFTQALRRKMDQIMPYFNQMYESQNIEYSALQTMSIKSEGSNKLTGNETANTENTTESQTQSGSRGINSSFPQTMLAGNEDYATAGNDLNSTSKVDGKGNLSASTDSESNSNTNNLVTGFQGVASDLITRFRNSLINVDTMILAEIEDCFMLLFNTGDEYFARIPRYGW